MATTNLSDLVVDSLTVNGAVIPAPTTGTLVNNGAVSITAGVFTLNKGSAITATLAEPTVTTDDYKRLTIVSLTAQAHTVAIATDGFGHGGANYIKATYGGAIGDSMSLIAFQGYWYVTGVQNVTFGVA
jgi:hypothetical protein